MAFRYCYLSSFQKLRLRKPKRSLGMMKKALDRKGKTFPHIRRQSRGTERYYRCLFTAKARLKPAPHSLFPASRLTDEAGVRPKTRHTTLD
jgi:hypothetical protein